MHEPQPPQRYSGAEKSPRLQRSVHFNSSNKQDTAPPVVDGGDDIMANVQAKIPFLLDLLNKVGASTTQIGTCLDGLLCRQKLNAKNFCPLSQI